MKKYRVLVSIKKYYDIEIEADSKENVEIDKNEHFPDWSPLDEMYIENVEEIE